MAILNLGYKQDMSILKWLSSDDRPSERLGTKIFISMPMPIQLFINVFVLRRGAWVRGVMCLSDANKAQN